MGADEGMGDDKPNEGKGRPWLSVPRPSREVVKRIVTAGADAPRALLEEAVRAMGGSANTVAGRGRAWSTDDVEAVAASMIRSHARLARLQGATLGAALTGLELSPMFGPAGELPASAAVLGIVTDITSIAWLQARLLLHLAALYGHDASDVDARLRELGIFFGVTELMQQAGRATGRVAETAGKRLILRHLRGDGLVAIKALFRMVGIKFTKKRLLEVVPLVNVPVFAVTNSRTVTQLGEQARAYFRDLPPGV